MAPVSLFDDSEDDDDEAKVTINKKFARDYEEKKLRQELQENNDSILADEDDDSSSEDEDEAAVLLTTKLDTNILKTIHALRTKDERIYDPNVTFFEQDDDSTSRSSKNGDDDDKPKYMKDVIREQVLEDMKKGGATDIEDDRPSRLLYDEKQQEARKAFLKAVYENDDDEEPVVVLKSASERQNPKDEIEFIRELEKLEQMKDTENTIVDPKGEVQDGEAFLLNYFKQRPWKEEEDSSSSDDGDEKSVPMKPGSRKQQRGDSDEDSLDQLEDADTFEAEYNFRFEQAAQDMSGADQSLQTYSRVNTISMRRTDDRRKIKRVERAERKAAERKAKEEQLRRLKNAKRKEMEEKLAQLKAVIGSGQDMDEEAIMKMLEGDFDPEQFEHLMKETYNEEYYNQEDPEWKNDRDVRKSLDLEFPDDEDGDLYDGNEYEDEEEEEEDDKKLSAEQEDKIIEEEEEWPDEEPPETELEQKVRAKMEDELYKLDYEDIVAGMPTRFKYRQVEPNNYGLTTEEILLARDTTLKQYVSLKKMAPYAESEYRVHGGKRRKFRELLKKDIEEQTQELEDAQPKEVVKKKKRRLRKKEKRESANGAEEKLVDDRPSPMVEKKLKKENDDTNTTKPPDANLVETKQMKDVQKVEYVETPKDRSKSVAEEKQSTSEGKDSSRESQSKKDKKKKKRKRKHKVQGVSATRMEAYGL